jgi:hypothetical protein
MKPLVALGLATAGVGPSCSRPKESRERIGASAKRWGAERLEHIMANLPEDAPPKLVMTLLPKLREQNDQIIALLQEQNGLRRERQGTSG